MILDFEHTIFNLKRSIPSLFFFLSSVFCFSQVTTEIDTTTIRIGEQISYKINVEADSTALVVFPEGQTFLPLESVEALKIDTTKKDKKFLLTRLYKLTQFDSGRYTIPRQKIIIDSKPFFTDSLKVLVSTVEVDTTKQNLYDIKPLINVEKPSSNWWKYLLIVLLCIGTVGFLLYWFIWRKKPLTEEEEIALLPPYERAKLGIKKLEEKKYLQSQEIKSYYSDLTQVIRKYLDEKVYDRALESTTDELISRLQLLKDGNQIPLKAETITHLESVLKRADLVKFAKSKPDIALAELDKDTIDKQIDHVKESLPEPSEEEKLLNQQYKEAQELKKKRRKIILTVAISLALLIATFIGFGIKYGFTNVVHTIFGHESKELLEGEWVKSAYGFPPVYIETPKVLKRENIDIPNDTLGNVEVALFRYNSKKEGLDIQVSTTNFTLTDENGQPKQLTDEEKAADILKASELFIAKMEKNGAQNITVKRDQFITPNAAEGLKTYGKMTIDFNGNNISSNYAIFLFRAENIRQQILLQWVDDDDYTQTIIDRITNSIELNPEEQEQEKE